MSSSEEVATEELEEIVVPTGEEGVFYVSQIAPIKAEEEAKPDAKEIAAEGEETAEDVEDESCSYQTEPTVAINPTEINEIAQRILEDRLRDQQYDAATMKKAASQVSFMIREEIKRLSLDRYRIISHVTVGEKCDQDISMNFLCLWKPEFDHYAIAKYEGPNLFATVLVFLIYKQ